MYDKHDAEGHVSVCKRWLFKQQKGINHEAKDGLLQGWQFEFKVLKVRQAMWNRSIPKEMNLDIIQ